jgi:hypothetical protein
MKGDKRDATEVSWGTGDDVDPSGGDVEGEEWLPCGNKLRQSPDPALLLVTGWVQTCRLRPGFQSGLHQ